MPCFNEYCRDLNQLLTPYDILRLKNHLGLTSRQFLERYTSQHVGPESGLPVVTLKPGDPQNLTCPFVTPRGCSVYENRPASCRTYPLMRGITRCRQTGRLTEQFMVLHETHCRGFDGGRSQTVQQWIDGQQIADYNAVNDKMMQIISLKNTRKPGVLDLKDRHMFFTALYDLDSFRSQITDNGILADSNFDPALVEKALEDNLALPEIGMMRVEQVLFNQ